VAVVRLICETCRRHWTLPPGGKRRSSCPRCRHLHFATAARHRERLHQIAREARREAVVGGPPPTADELLALMGEADSKAARALALALTLAAGFKVGGT
jgi:hypothetical protein